MKRIPKDQIAAAEKDLLKLYPMSFRQKMNKLAAIIGDDKKSNNVRLKAVHEMAKLSTAKFKKIDVLTNPYAKAHATQMHRTTLSRMSRYIEYLTVVKSCIKY